MGGLDEVLGTSADNDAAMEAMANEEVRAGAVEPEPERPAQESADAVDTGEAEEGEGPAPAGDDGQQKPDEQQRDQRVPLRALQEERQRRQTLERQHAETRAKMERMEAEFARLTGQSQKPQGPTFEEDPLTFIKNQQEQMVRTAQEQRHAQEAARHQEAALSSYQAAAASYAKETPDFGDAYTHVVTTRVAELEYLGYTEAEAKQAVLQEEMAIVATANRLGRNPAEMVYEIAQKRGYQKAAPKPAPAQQRIEAQVRGQAAAKSLSNGSGKANGFARTLEDLAAMPEGPAKDKAWDRIVGSGR